MEGIECPQHRIQVHEDTDLEALLTEINDQRRQRLTAAARKQMVAALSEAGWSYRRIADEVGGSKSQVAKDVAELSRGGQLEKPEATKGKDGKVRATSSTKRQAAAARSGRRAEPAKMVNRKDLPRVADALKRAGAEGLTVADLAEMLNLPEEDLRVAVPDIPGVHRQGNKFVHDANVTNIFLHGFGETAENTDRGPYPYGDLDLEKFLPVPWTPETWDGDDEPDPTPAEQAIEDLHRATIAVEVFARSCIVVSPVCAELADDLQQLVASVHHAETLRREVCQKLRGRIHPARLAELKLPGIEAGV